jgi:methylated-DNA-[protein]-cysteine S-methyltransferase
VQVRVLDSRVALDSALVAESRAEIRRQVDAYLARERRAFDLTVDLPDSFVGEVMAAMCEIPYGETRTYGDIAARLDTAPVAVGQACGHNPVPLVVPCHRVVGAGDVGGYSAGSGPALKRALLRLERGHLDGQRRLAAFE